MLPRICIVTDRKLAQGNLLDHIGRFLEFGFDFIQLREKDLPAIEVYKLAKEIIKTWDDSIRLIINDRVDVAYLVNAAGVHLGIAGLPSKIVKDNFSNLTVGISVHNIDELKRNSCFDYVFFGNVFETDCKSGLEGKGIKLLREIVQMTDKPVYAIGGINPDNALDVLKAGAYGIAVRSLPFKDINGLVRIKKIIGEYYG